MIFEMIFKSLKAKPMRTLLTMLSIIIGVVSVILIDSVSTTGTAAVSDELSALGIDCISVTADDSNDFVLKNSDIELIGGIDGVKTVSGIYSEGGTITADDKKENRPYRHSFSYGIAEAAAGCNSDINEMIKTVDEKMYQQKLLKKAAASRQPAINR